MSFTGPPVPPAPIPGRWLTLARLAWFLLAAPVAAIVVYGIVTNAVDWWQMDLSGCPPGADYEACLVDNQAMRQAGISPRFFAIEFTAGLVIQNLSWIVVGGLIFWRKSASLFSLFFSLMMVLVGGLLLDGIFEVILQRDFPQLAPPLYFLEAAGSSLLILWYRFPDGRFVPGWMRWPAGLWFVGLSLVGLFFPRSPLAPDNWPFSALMIDNLFLLSIVLALVYRYRYLSGPVQRQQIKWVVVFAVFFVLMYVLDRILWPSVPPGMPNVVRSLTVLPLHYIASGLIAASFGIAILRYHLWDIDIIVRRTLTYSLLTAILALVYFGSVIVLQTVLSALTGQTGSPVVTVLSTLAIAALFTPLRRQVKTLIDRGFYRRRYNAEQTLADFSRGVRDEVDLAALSERLVKEVEETMQPERVSLWLREP
jgi:hypothetical protein